MNDLNLILGLSNLLCALVSGAVAISLLRGRVKMNDFYGVRFAQAMESPDNWRKLNQTGARYMLFWSAIIAAIGIACFLISPLNPTTIWIFGLTPCLIGISCLQTYLYARRL
jgi:hypothetical protein